VTDEEIGMVRADETLLAPFLSGVHAASGGEAAALLVSVEDAVRQSSGAIEEIEGQRESQAARQVLSYRELVQYEYGTAMFRTLAMAERLGRLTGATELASAARNALQRRLSGYLSAARLTPVPLESSTRVQMEAILAAARSLSADQG
jgi:hypothetical protein